MTFTRAEITQRSRDKKTKKGLVRVEVWVKPSHVERIKKIARSLT